MDYPEYYTEEELMVKVRHCSPFGDIEDFEMWNNLFRLRISHIWWLGNLETGEIKCGVGAMTNFATENGKIDVIEADPENDWKIEE